LHLGYGVFSLIIINLIVTGIIVIVNFLISKNKFISFKIFTKVKWYWNYIKQGFSFSLLSFLQIFNTRIDLVMLSFLTTPEKVGIYALAYRIVEKGLVIRKPISQSLFPYYTKKVDKNKIGVNTLIKHTLIIGLPAFIIALIVPFISKFVIVTIVGNDFTASAQVLNVLVFYLILNYMLIPWGLNLQTSYFESYVIKITLITAILNILLNILLFYRYDILGIAYSTLITYFINVGLNIYINYKKIYSTKIQ
jgi:O-antigen/teichoic acid export membrane protein